MRTQNIQRRSEAPRTSRAADPAPGHDVQRRALRGMTYDQAVQQLAPVQRAGDTGDVHAAAQRGTAGGGGALPHQAAIQRSFGGHDVSAIKSHSGGQASEACHAMGAQAYASGDAVAFAGAPDLHTAAHEAAHVVQQRAGVQLSGGVGQVGDPYERQADAVADRVVQGKSAEDLLGSGGGSGAGAVQRAVQAKGGLMDSIKEFFTGAKLTGEQKQIAEVLAKKYQLDVTGIGATRFASMCNDAMQTKGAKDPAALAAAMASAVRDELAERENTGKRR